MGFRVSKLNSFIKIFSSSESPASDAKRPASKTFITFSKTPLTSAAILFPERISFFRLSSLFATTAISEKINSKFITSISDFGLTSPETWITFRSEKLRTIWQIASTSLILAKNLLPKPSPLWAPATNPAISTNFTVVGIVFLDFDISESLSNLASGNSTMPTFGSIVQKEKLDASTCFFVKALKTVDLPTFGRPAIPIDKLIDYIVIWLYGYMVKLRQNQYNNIEI